MLWIALKFPHLALESLPCCDSDGEPDRAPLAVREGRTLFACNAAAHALGARVGMTVVGAQAIAPGLQIRLRAPETERVALGGIAAWACAFTPTVVLEPPDMVFAEIRGSLRRFGGLEALIGRLRAGLAEQGFEAQLAVAPSARGAGWLAHGAPSCLVSDPAALQATLDRLPVEVACDSVGMAADLRHLGIPDLGSLRRLPRAGLARRFGVALCDRLDRAYGIVPDPQRVYVPPESFRVRLELPSVVLLVEGVLFPLRRLLIQLEGALTARQAGIRSFQLTLFHESVQPSRIEIALASPARSAERCLRLLRERLATFALPAPVQAIALEAGAFTSLPMRTAGLFGDPQAQDEAWLQLIERLQLRLGAQAVRTLVPAADHRPERAWCPIGTDIVRRPVSIAAGERPLWLVDPPRRLRVSQGRPRDDGPLALLAGPERFESGWWDGDDLARDYFIARTMQDTLVWVFCQPGGAWYLHGIFA